MCGSDEPTRHEPQTRCQKLMLRIQSLVFTGLAVYTIYSLFMALEQVTRTDLQLSTTPPDDRCIPFFDTVNEYLRDYPASRGVFDYRAGDAITRICTNETSATVLDKIGQKYAYDPWKEDTNCDVLGSDKSDFLANCRLVNFAGGVTCEDILNITPAPYGVHWNAYAQLLTGNDTDTGLPYPRCTIRVTKVTSIADCEETTMQPMHHVDKNVSAFMVIGVIIPFVVMALQTYACHKYSQTWAAEDGPLLAFASRGPIGGIYMFWWVCKEGQEGRGEFPDTFLSFGGWLACAIQDAVEGLAVPLVSILGCSLDRFPVNVVLVVLKAIKIIYDFVMYFKNRKETSEPGGEAEQRALWASNPPKPAEGSGQQMQQIQPTYPQPVSYPANSV